METPFIPCPYCGRLMHPSAKTCGNYCRWSELVNGNKKAA